MENFKGTKGKWVVEYSNRDDSYDIYNENKEEFVCTTMNSLDLEKYNAQLIAHAPEMLEFIKSIVDDYNDGLIDDVEHIAIRAEQLFTRATTI